MLSQATKTTTARRGTTLMRVRITTGMEDEDAHSGSRSVPATLSQCHHENGALDRNLMKIDLIEICFSIKIKYYLIKSCNQHFD